MAKWWEPSIQASGGSSVSAMHRAVSSRPAPRKVTCGGITSFSLTMKRPRGTSTTAPPRSPAAFSADWIAPVSS